MKSEGVSVLRGFAQTWKVDTWVKPYFARYKRALLASVGLGVLTVAFASMLMLVSGFLISYAAMPPELGLFSLFFPIGLVQIFGLGKPFFGYFERLASHDWVLRMTSSLRERLYCSLEREGIVGSRIIKAGEALGLLSEDIAHVQNLYLRTVFPLVIAWVMGGLVVIAVGAMSLPCAVMLLVGFVVIMVLLPLQALLVSGARIAKVKALKAQLYARAYDDVMGIGDWVYSQRKDDFCNSLVDVTKEIDAIEERIAASSIKRGLVLNVLFVVMLVALLAWAGGYFGAANPAGAAALVGAISDGQPGNWIAAIVLGFFPLLEALQPLPDAAAGAAAHFDSIKHLNAFDESDGEGKAVECGDPADFTLCLKGVSFAYAQDQVPVLEGVTLRIEPGQKLAILGASGSGKSTLLHLIRGDLAPSKGSVTLGGVPTSQLNEARHIHRYMGYLQQNSYLFAQTLRGNLKIGKPQVMDEEARRALKAAGLGSLLERLPEGLDVQVDESGLRFSGGERQRIALARLLLADTPVVLLDEPTVSLDPLTEAKLLDTMFDVLRDRTVVMVTHHLQGIEHMDRVLFVQDGRVVIDGSPCDLARNNPLFRRLLAFDRGVELD